MLKQRWGTLLVHLFAKFFPGQCNGHMSVAICCSIRRSCGHGGECNLHVRVGFASHTPAKKESILCPALTPRCSVPKTECNALLALSQVTWFAVNITIFFPCLCCLGTSSHSAFDASAYSQSHSSNFQCPISLL